MYDPWLKKIISPVYVLSVCHKESDSFDLTCFQDPRQPCISDTRHQLSWVVEGTLAFQLISRVSSDLVKQSNLLGVRASLDMSFFQILSCLLSLVVGLWYYHLFIWQVSLQLSLTSVIESYCHQVAVLAHKYVPNRCGCSLFIKQHVKQELNLDMNPGSRSFCGARVNELGAARCDGVVGRGLGWPCGTESWLLC